jgi:hypothetical protein
MVDLDFQHGDTHTITMSLLGTGQSPSAGSSAEAEALIAEARARARRRRRRIAVAVLCAVAVAAGSLAAAGALPGSRPAGAGGGAVGATAGQAGPPAYFIDATSMGSAYTSPEIRASATGRLVGSTPIGSDPRLRDYDPPYGLAATGPDSFVVGLMTPSDCSTQFFRFSINGQGRPGALTQVGPTRPGELTSMAASAGGGLIAYVIDRSGCPTSGHGSYLGVFDPVTGRTRQWTDAPTYMSQLSMSANGRLLAFTQELTRPVPHSNGGFQITGYQVRVLATDAAPGTVDGRSRVAAAISPQDSLFAALTVLLSPTGTSFYLCVTPFAFPERGAKRITDTVKVVAYRTATGRATGVLAAWAASYAPDTSGFAPVTLSCSSMALDPSGRFLLVPYLETSDNPSDQTSSGSLTGARVNTATGARSDWTIAYGDGQDFADMSIAW